MSDTRWHQVVTGIQRKSGGLVPVNPTDRTVISMANAVGVDPGDALEAAGYARLGDEQVAAILREMENPAPITADSMGGLADQIERIKNLKGVSPKDRIRMVNALIELHEESGNDEDGR